MKQGFSLFTNEHKHSHHLIYFAKIQRKLNRRRKEGSVRPRY